MIMWLAWRASRKLKSRSCAKIPPHHSAESRWIPPQPSSCSTTGESIRPRPNLLSGWARRVTAARAKLSFFADRLRAFPTRCADAPRKNFRYPPSRFRTNWLASCSPNNSTAPSLLSPGTPIQNEGRPEIDSDPAAPVRIARSHLINGQPSSLVNSDSHNFDSGAESAAALQPRATPWVSESIGPPCKGGGFLRPCRAEHVLGHVPGALPRAGMLRAVGASSWLRSRAERTATKRFIK